MLQSDRRAMAEKGVGIRCRLARLCFKSAIACAVPADNAMRSPLLPLIARTVARSGYCINE
jgi:hypothetical protein